jgi:LysM repeat protein
MKKSFLLAILLYTFSSVLAQKELQVQHGDKGLYVVHTVAAKENYYSIGRIYNILPKDIETFNGLDMNKGLVVGQALKIPLSASNFSQQSETGKAVYYAVGAKEGLYRVSLRNNNVLMASLRKWNHLASDNIKTGQKLIVGFLVTDPSATVAAPKQEKAQPETVHTEPVKKETPVQKEEVAVTEPVKKPEPPAPKPAAYPVSAPADGSGGYFKSHYEQQVRTQPARTDITANAGIFKTASGWQDFKYYLLIDNVEPGTIVRIINPSNNKTVYAKVLGEMSGIRQNQGYDIRMSNAAAAALEVGETEKFVVRVVY